MSTELQLFEQHAQRYEVALRNFTKLYRAEHPMPIAPPWYAHLPYLMIPFSLIALCGIALSSMRTAPVFYEMAKPLIGEAYAVVEAVIALVVIECSVVFIRYLLVLDRKADNELDQHELRGYMRAGFWLAFGVAVLANVYGSTRHLLVAFFPLEAANVADGVMALVVGACAPILAFISGDILASIYLRADTRRRDARQVYEAALAAWNDRKETVWQRRKRDYGLRLDVDDLSAQTDTDRQTQNDLTDRLSVSASDQTSRQTRQTRQAGYGYARVSSAQQRVVDYLSAHPGDAGLDVRTLGERVGVGKDAARLGRLRWQNEHSSAVEVTDVSLLATRSAAANALEPVAHINGTAIDAEGED